jgi:hypothetical protein
VKTTTPRGHGIVPGCVPGEYGDYVIMSVAADGKIDGWRPTAEQIVQAFFPEER